VRESSFRLTRKFPIFSIDYSRDRNRKLALPYFSDIFFDEKEERVRKVKVYSVSVSRVDHDFECDRAICILLTDARLGRR
jgi:hypothetical protein